MNELQFLAIAIIVIGILCKLDLMRTNRRALNRRNWEVLFHAEAFRRMCQSEWREAFEDLTLLAHPQQMCELRTREERAYKDWIVADNMVFVAHINCKGGKCPADLKHKL